MDAWIDSKLFWISGLNADEIRNKVLQECRNGGDFLRIIMEEMARQQGVRRWADCTPEHLLYLDRIKKTIPDALIIHIIRDGRDVALSMEKGNWIRPFPWDKKESLMVAGLYWEWIVGKGRESGRTLGADYTEVRFEELVTRPRETLTRLGSFVDQGLDYDRIREVGIGSVREPNTSFRSESDGAEFNPVGRWRHKLQPTELRKFERLVGKTLQELGYQLGANDSGQLEHPELNKMRTLYRAYFNSKLWLKANTPLSRFLVTRDLGWV